MICVAENDLSLYIVAEFVDMNAFYRTECTDRHKNRCFDFSVIGSYHAGSRVASGCGCVQFEIHFSEMLGDMV